MTCHGQLLVARKQNFHSPILVGTPCLDGLGSGPSKISWLETWEWRAWLKSPQLCSQFLLKSLHHAGIGKSVLAIFAGLQTLISYETLN